MKKITLLFIFMVFWAVSNDLIAQIQGINPKYITDRFVDSTGRVIVEVVVPGIPPDNFRMPEAVPSKAAVLLANVPGFSWSFGCSATAAAMQAAYYDRTGYYNMYAGPTQGGLMPMNNSSWGDVTINGAVEHQCPLSATRNGLDGRTNRGHVDDYWILYGSTANDPYITNGWTQHTWGQCTGDYMGTNQSALGNSDGNTTFYYYEDGTILCNHVAPAGHKDGCYGLRKFYESRGYTVVSNCTRLIYGLNGNTQGFTFAQYKQEIDAGRPVLIQVEGHTMLGYGYDNTGSLVYLHDTWDYLSHTMTWGGSYSGMAHWGVTTIELQAYTPDPCSNIISLGGGGSANSKTYWGGGEGVWFTSSNNPCGYTTPGIEQIYSFVAPVTGVYSIEVTTANGYVDYLWKASSCSSSGWNCIDDIAYTGTYGSMSWTAGTTYYILLDDESGTEGEHTFYVFLNPCLNVTSIGGTGSGNAQTYAGGGNGAWFTSTYGPCDFVCPGREKVYSFVPAVTGLYNVVVTSASGYVDYFWKASSCSATGWSCIDDILNPGTYGAMLMVAGTTYHILLDDENTTAGAHTFYINPSDLPNTWAGLVSNDWYNSANWSANFVPNSTTNVEINTGYTYYPIINSGTANCNNITVGAGTQLKIGAGRLDVAGSITIHGLLTMDNAAGVMAVLGDVAWESGSTANFTADIVFWVHGDWNFNAGANANLANGNVDFTGSGTSWIRSYSATCSLPKLASYKTGTDWLRVSDLSTQPLTINGSIYIQPSCNFGISSSQEVILKGSLLNHGNYNFTGAANTGTFVFDGTSQSVNHFTTGTGLFNSVRFSSSTGTTALNNITVANNLTIDQGTFNPGSTTVSVGGNWSNMVGTPGFSEGTSRVIFNGGNYHQYCSSETFNTLELNKASGGALRMAGTDVVCAAYDWTAGAVDVLSGSFTANDLLDNGIYGAYYNNAGGTINLTNSGTNQWVDLDGELHIFGGTVNVYGSVSDWSYNQDALIEMSSGILDFHTCGISIYNGSNVLTENITGGTIRTAYGFTGNRADFTPAAGTFEFYGSTDATINQSNGCTLYDVNINKVTKDGDLLQPILQKTGERIDKTLGKGGKSNALSMTSDFAISHNLTITAGSLNLGSNQLDVNNNVDIYGQLVMNNVSDKINANAITWMSGSTDNVTNGEIHVNYWCFNDGTNAMLDSPNTAFVSSGIDTYDADATFGNLVAVSYSRGKLDPKTIYPLRVAGYFTIQSGANWQSSADIYVNGVFDIQTSASFALYSNNSVYLNSPFVLNGLFEVNAGHVLCHGEFASASTGSLIIDGGSFIADSPNHPDKGWEYLLGNLTMPSGLFEITYNSIQFGSGATTSVSGGILRTGGAFGAFYPGAFNPTGGAVEVTGNLEPDAAIVCGNGNSFYNLVINRSAGTASSLYLYDIFVQNDLTIQSGVLNSNGLDITLGGDWNNWVGTDGFIEGTGAVTFNGSMGADVLSGETFYDLNLNKTFPDFDGLELWQDVAVTNNLHILDGSMELNNPAGLIISGNLTIDLNGGLNANDMYGPQIFVGGQWLNQNSSYTTEYGFDPGYYSTVTFNGTTDQTLSTGALWEDFNSLVVDKSSGMFRPDDNIQSYGNILISNGTWEDNPTGLYHIVHNNFTVEPSGAFFNAIPRNTVEFKGAQNSILTYSGSTGYFHNLVINKDPGYSVTQVGNTSCQFDGNLTIVEGGYNVNGYFLSVFGDAAINNTGSLMLSAGSTFMMSDAHNLNVNSGGSLNIAGTAGNQVNILGNIPAARYGFNVNSGGTIAADYCCFKNMHVNGVFIQSGATVDPAHAFTGCTFQDGATGGVLLAINNNQTLTIHNAVFPANTWGGGYNVAKTLNQGHVYFVDYSGDFSGEAYDYDGYNLIDWVTALLANATANPESICPGGTSQLNANPSGGVPPYSFAWTPTGSLSNPSIVNPVANPGISTNYEVIVTDAFGTTVTDNVMVTVNPVLPVSVTIVASANPVCAGTGVTFTATPVNGGSNPSYLWKVNTVTVPGATNSTYSYVPVNSDNIQCVLTSNASCASGNPATSNTIVMTVNPVLPVSVTIVASANPVCAGTGVTFTATPVNGGSNPSYLWKVNTITVPGATNSTYSYVPVNGDNIQCILTSNATCASGNPATSNTIVMTVNPVLPVSVTIAASGNPVPQGTVVTYTATPVNGGGSPFYQWKVNGANAGTNASSYSYTPVSGDQIWCILTSNVPCPSGNPATSNLITMTVIPESLSVTGTVPSGTINCYDAINTITVAGGGTTFEVQSGGTATFIAGNKILFLYGTRVQSGGIMHGYITTTNSYCPVLPLAMVSAVTGEMEQPVADKSIGFSIFPNPANGKFTLLQKGEQVDGIVKVEILGMCGERLRSETLISERTHEFSVRDLPVGLYLVKVVKDDYVEVFKLILSR